MIRGGLQLDRIGRRGALVLSLLVLAAQPAAGDCSPVLAGYDTTSWNTAGRTFLGKAVGQTFYAFDTLIARLTVWRYPNNLSGAIETRLFVTTVDTVNYDPPRPITQGILQNGPVVFVRDSDPPGLPIRMDFILNPALALPHRGTYAFFLQREGCDWGETAIMGKEPGDYPYGTFWYTGRTANLPCFLRSVDWWWDLDLCFEIEYQPPVPGIALESSHTDPCAVRLAWSASNLGGRVATLYRHTPATDWSLIGPLVPDGTGRLAYEDRDIGPESRYGYRLRVDSCDPETSFGETWVDTPPLPRLVLESAGAEPCGRTCAVALVWTNGGSPVDSATLWRRTDDTDWSPLATLAADSDGRFRYADQQVSPGTPYGYRLGIQLCGLNAYSPESWVAVPAAELALRGVRPNPAGAELAVSLALRDGSPARLELIDLAGRRVLVREVGSLGRGPHVVALREVGTLRAGVYLVRLTQGGQSLTARAVIFQ